MIFADLHFPVTFASVVAFPAFNFVRRIPRILLRLVLSVKHVQQINQASEEEEKKKRGK